MHKMILRLRIGREFVFECESYTIERLKYDGSLDTLKRIYQGGDTE